MQIKNKKGFTLIEVMISTLLISMLAVVAISSYFNSTATFSFLGVYKNIVSDLRMARSFAINNKTIANVQSERYGVCIRANSLVVFADNGNKPLAYEAPDNTPANQCPPVPANEAPPGDQDTVIKTYQFPAYTISAYASKADLIANNPVPMPLAVVPFYDKGTGNFTFTQDGSTVVSKSTNKYLILKLSEGTKRMKYIVIFQVSGLAEEYDNLDSLQ